MIVSVSEVLAPNLLHGPFWVEHRLSWVCHVDYRRDRVGKCRLLDDDRGWLKLGPLHFYPPPVQVPLFELWLCLFYYLSLVVAVA